MGMDYLATVFHDEFLLVICTRDYRGRGPLAFGSTEVPRVKFVVGSLRY